MLHVLRPPGAHQARPELGLGLGLPQWGWNSCWRNSRRFGRLGFSRAGGLGRSAPLGVVGGLLWERVGQLAGSHCGAGTAGNAGLQAVQKEWLQA